MSSSSNTLQSGVERLAASVALLTMMTFGLLVFGASVRVHGAGLACPDWPLCFGEVVPELNFQVFLEFGHRVLASIISVGTFIVAGLVWLRKDLSRFRALVVVMLLVLAVQVVLGGLTVLELLAEWTVASHLVTGNIFCLLLLSLFLGLREASSPVSRSTISVVQRAIPLVLGLVLLTQLALGGLVSSSHAGLACGTWPSCNGDSAFPTLSGLVGLQVLHRIMAYALLGLAFVNVVSQRGAAAFRPAVLLLVLVVAQAGLGIASVLTQLLVELRLLHSGGAAALVLTTTWLHHEVWRAPTSLITTVLEPVEA